MLPGVTAEVTSNAARISIAEYVMLGSRRQCRFCYLSSLQGHPMSDRTLQRKHKSFTKEVYSKTKNGVKDIATKAGYGRPRDLQHRMAVPKRASVGEVAAVLLPPIATR